MPRPHPGDHWRRLIWKARLSQQETARRSQISAQHLSRILNGHSLPSVDVTRRFALTVGRSPAKLWAEVAAYQLAIARAAEEEEGHADTTEDE